MPNPKPLWREFFDKLEEPLRETAEKIAASENFNVSMIEMQKLRARLNDKAHERISGVMHTFNIPSYNDVTKLSRQLGLLTHKVDTLQINIENIEDLIEEGQKGETKEQTVTEPPNTPKRKVKARARTKAKTKAKVKSKARAKTSKGVS